MFDLISTPSFKNEFLEHLSTLEIGNESLDAIRMYLDSAEFREDILQIRKGAYSFSIPYEQQIVTDNKSKIRTVWVFSEREKSLQRLILYALHRYDRKFSDCVQLGLQKNVRWETTLRKIKNYDKLYYFTTDIHNCSNSINRDLMLEKLEAFIDDDPVLLKYLQNFIQSCQCMKNGRLCYDRCAVPAGSPLCVFLINVYLREVDSCIEAEADFYTRLTDRIVIGCFCPEKLKHLQETVLKAFQNLELQVNEDETHFLRPGESFDFRGKRVAGKEIDFSPLNLANIKRGLRKYAIFAKKKLNGLDPQVRAYLCIYRLETSRIYIDLQKAFPTVTTARSYKELDHCIQNLLREIISGKAGSKKYSCTYKDLQNYGYKSLTCQYFKYLKQCRPSVKKENNENLSGMQ